MISEDLGLIRIIPCLASNTVCCIQHGYCLPLCIQYTLSPWHPPNDLYHFNPSRLQHSPKFIFYFHTYFLSLIIFPRCPMPSRAADLTQTMTFTNHHTKCPSQWTPLHWHSSLTHCATLSLTRVPLPLLTHNNHRQDTWHCPPRPVLTTTPKASHSSAPPTGHLSYSHALTSQENWVKVAPKVCHGPSLQCCDCGGQGVAAAALVVAVAVAGRSAGHCRPPVWSTPWCPSTSLTLSPSCINIPYFLSHLHESLAFLFQFWSDVW